VKRHILGLSAYYHDSAAALLRDGKIIAAAQEERFTRIKNDAKFPAQAINACLEVGGLQLSDVDAVIFYDKPLLKFDRLLETYFQYAPKGLYSFSRSMPIWLKEKLYLKSVLRTELSRLSGLRKTELPQLLFSDHHRSHAASAFFPSPFKKAAVLCLDGVGEWATTSAWLGEGGRLTPLWEIRFPHSLGLLYSAFTYYCGFKVNSGEYKLMGLAAYGEPRFRDLIFKELIDLKADGTFRLNPYYFDYAVGPRMTNTRFEKLFDGPPRVPESPLDQKTMDLAASIQTVAEEVVLRLAETLRKEAGAEYLCLAGGVALNCVVNGRLLRSGIFRDVWVQPAAGDAGGALGAALSAWHEHMGHPRKVDVEDAMAGALLGKQYADLQIKNELDAQGAAYERKPQIFEAVAREIAQGRVVGFFSGRSEFGPRALGARSILADARHPEMQSKLNLKIKFRESFRPFAPAVLQEDASRYFDLDRPSPYMLLAAEVAPSLRNKLSGDEARASGLARLGILRSQIPAVTHVDYSARVQTVSESQSPTFHRLIAEFKRQTGCGVLINTSFNIRGEPIVETPTDAYRCFMKTDMDVLAIGDFFLRKEDQAVFQGEGDSVAIGVRGRLRMLSEKVERFYAIVLLSLLYFAVITPVGIFRRKAAGGASAWCPNVQLPTYREVINEKSLNFERPF